MTILQTLCTELMNRWSYFTKRLKTEWLVWLFVFVGSVSFFVWFQPFDIRTVVLLLCVILFGIAFNIRPEILLSILTLLFTSVNIATQTQQFRVVNNATVVFETPSVFLPEKRIIVHSRNIGNTIAYDFKFGATLLKALFDEKRNFKGFEEIQTVFMPGTELYPKEPCHTYLQYTKGDEALNDDYFLICYLVYTTIGKEHRECERFYHYEDGGWSLWSQFLPDKQFIPLLTEYSKLLKKHRNFK